MHNNFLYVHNINGDIMQKIKCDVYDCMNCNCDKQQCKLNEIKVCSCATEETKEATMCNSYKKRK